MIAVLLVSHGDLANALLHAAEMIMGPQPGVSTLCLDASESLATFHLRVASAVQAADRGEGVLVLVDLAGGTPANASLAALRTENCMCLSGANLPMLLEVLQARETCGLSQLTQRVLTAGRNGIVDLRAALEGIGDPEGESLP